MKAVYICFIYGIHIFIVYWLVERFQEKSRNFIVNIIMIMLIVFDWCIQHVQCAQIGAFIASRTCVKHNRAITARIIYALEKTIYRLKKTIYSLKRLFTAWKDYLQVEKYYLGLKRLFTGWKILFTALTWFLQKSEFIFDHMTHF